MRCSKIVCLVLWFSIYMDSYAVCLQECVRKSKMNKMKLYLGYLKLKINRKMNVSSLLCCVWVRKSEMCECVHLDFRTIETIGSIFGEGMCAESYLNWNVEWQSYHSRGKLNDSTKYWFFRSSSDVHSGFCRL